MEAKLDLLDMIERYKQYGWSKRAICAKWEICAKTLRNIEGRRPLRKSSRVAAINAITAAEQSAVVAYALKHTELNHREMSYRMIDEDVAYMSASSVYRILRRNNLLPRKEMKPRSAYWDAHAHPEEVDSIWQTDLMVIHFKGRDFFLLSYIDVTSRFIPFHKLCTSMTSDTIKEATSDYLADAVRKPKHVQSDNGSCYIGIEYRNYLAKADIEHHRIHPYCPNENAEIERYHRTLRERIDLDDVDNFDQLVQLVKDQIDYYNHTRLHSAIGFVTPDDKYCGRAETIIEKRKEKLQKAKEKRIKENLKIMIKKAA